jgi:5-(carboxyamino)imidazole ribonucleotide mutase
MKVLIVFGSTSDEFIYAPLCKKLSENNFEVSFSVISAHRAPDELEERLSRNDFDIVIGGAGLSAHLPGVIASKVSQLTLGVAVDSAYSGLDSYYSIVNMPFGVPVLGFSPGTEKNLITFMNTLKKLKQYDCCHIRIPENISNEGFIKKELDRTLACAKENKIELSLGSDLKDDMLNIIIINSKNDLINCDNGIYIPVFSREQKKNTQTAIDVFNWSKELGPWGGVNNCRNVILSVKKLSNRFKEI